MVFKLFLTNTLQKRPAIPPFGIEYAVFKRVGQYSKPLSWLVRRVGWSESAHEVTRVGNIVLAKARNGQGGFAISPLDVL